MVGTPDRHGIIPLHSDVDLMLDSSFVCAPCAQFYNAQLFARTTYLCVEHMSLVYFACNCRNYWNILASLIGLLLLVHLCRSTSDSSVGRLSCALHCSITILLYVFYYEPIMSFVALCPWLLIIIDKNNLTQDLVLLLPHPVFYSHTILSLPTIRCV